MITLIVNGGVVPMSFILAFGGFALGAAFYLAIRAEAKTLGFVKWMALATLFATLAATSAAVGATLQAVSDAWPADRGRALHMLVQGLGESTSPGILGASLLAVTAMLTAIGRRRLDERGAVR